MGACGCGDYQPMFRFPGPDGTVYALEVYAGCGDCATGPGVMIHRHGEEGRRDWDVDHLPELPFHDLGAPEGQFAMPILSWESARKRFVPLAQDPDQSDDFGAKMVVDDILREGLRHAVIDTIEQWQESRKADIRG